MINAEQVLKDIRNQIHGEIAKVIECPMTLGVDYIKKNTCLIQVFEKTADGHMESIFYLGYVGTEIAPGVRESYAKEIRRFRKCPEIDPVLSGGTIEKAMFTAARGLIIEVDYWGTIRQLEPYDYSYSLPLREWI